MRTFISFLALFLILYSCNNSLLINIEKVEDVEKSCERLRIRKFKQLNNCEKLSYLNGVRSYKHRISSKSFIDLLMVMNQETGIWPSLIFNFAGGFYPSDTLFDYDMKKWSKSLGCDSIVQYKRVN